MRILTLFSAVALSLAAGGTGLASPVEQTPDRKVQESLPIVDDDATLGVGQKPMIVFLDRGIPEMRQQVPVLMAFSAKHPDWIVDIKDTPVFSKASITIAEAEGAVIHQQDPQKWHDFEMWVDAQDTKNLTAEALRAQAIRSGLNADEYDKAIQGHHALSVPELNRSMLERAKAHQLPMVVVGDKVVFGIQSPADLEALAGAP